MTLLTEEQRAIQDKQFAQAQLGRDLQDIRTLRKNEAFNRYWVEQLKRKRAETDEKFRNDPADKCSPARREELRQQLILLDDLLGMMDRHEAVLVKQLEPA